MLFRVGGIRHLINKKTLLYIICEDIDTVFSRDKTEEAQNGLAHIIAEHGCNRMSVICQRGEFQCGDTALIATKDKTETGMPAEELIPHLFGGIATRAVVLDPLHASFGIVDMTFLVPRFFTNTKIHVRGDQTLPIRVFLKHFIGPCKHVIGRIALQTEVNEIDATCTEILGTVDIVG